MERIDKRDNESKYMIVYDSFEEAVSFAEDRERDGSKTREEDASISGTRSFTGTEDLQECFDLARYGWQEGTDDVADAVADIEDQATSDAPGSMFANDVNGGMLDMGKYVNGEPDCFIKKRKVSGKEEIVTMAISVSASHQVERDVLINRGAAVCSAIDALENSGVSVEVYAVTDSDKNEDNWSHVVPVKQPDERLDMGRVVFALAHPSYLRRFMFALSENHGSDLRNFFRVGIGYGTPTRKKEEMVSPEAVDADVKMAGIYGDDADAFRTPEMAAETVQKELKEQGISVEIQ